MTSSIPFAITPDAEDFLRDRMNQMPPEVQPVLIRATSQNDGLNHPRWTYNRESFIIGYFDPGEKPKEKCIESELFGRRICIESDVLKHLSGRTLSLRRVDAGYGLVRNPRYVLVADSVPAPSAGGFRAEDFNEKVNRYFMIGAFTVLGGFTGMGVIWLLGAVVMLKISESKFWHVIYYVFVAGWIMGATISFFFFKSAFKRDIRTKFGREQTLQKFAGASGMAVQFDMCIFMGIPASSIAVSFVTLSHFVNMSAHNGLGTVILLVGVLGVSMYFCDKMRHRLVFWFGILGWVVTFIIGYLFFKVHGP